MPRMAQAPRVRSTDHLTMKMNRQATAVRATALRQRGTDTPDGPPRESRLILVDAKSFDDAKRQVHNQMPGPDWIVLSWRELDGS